MKMKINIQLKPILAFLAKYQALLVIVAVLALCGYTGYQISLVVAVTPTAANLEAAQEQQKSTAVHFDNVTIDAIVHQKNVVVAPNLNNLGTTNPFFGN